MKHNKIARVFKSIGFGLLFVFLGLFISFTLMEAILPKQTINVFQMRTYIAKYDTMEPEINPYDLVFVNKIDPNDLVPGDKITFYASVNYDGKVQLVTYEVYSIQGTGDQRAYRAIPEGATVPYSALLDNDDIIGGYMFSIPFAGRVIEFIKSPFGIGALAMNILIITSIVILVKSGKKNKITE